MTDLGCNQSQFRLNRQFRNAHNMVAAPTRPADVVYDGKEEHGLRSGHGTLTFANGDSYVGEFSKGFRHGRGVYTYLHGTIVYDGEWRRSLRHGHGKEVCREKDQRIVWSYEGEYVNDTKHGQGTERKTAQGTYVGSFANGLKDGAGVMTWQNGNSYDGQWRQGRMCGLDTSGTRTEAFTTACGSTGYATAADAPRRKQRYTMECGRKASSMAKAS
ncbi:hypothetical protein H310_08137 [Aphanomyces invadans]|uniref:MORN repeat-containing protein 5 n=1 Tax=Aphanomyces invadans TaxID=157072 RepID=A0A024U0P9_9STRA|nr:hypothetical protein H310_08137 [Aphanomyces invadans]ETV99446.1 hypothetical protein H310_08137 [Aphanomyces invadans]|eukprot:XP_008872002.1 hypothetical protein H310_08137 [Aphanomyces invadans]